MKRELKESFEIRVSGTDNWYEMSVPGSAMDTLVKEGVLPDPYYGENEYEVREFFRNDFDIRGHFTVSQEEFSSEHMLLVFHGIDTVADLYLNGHKLGHTENMHRRFSFSIKEWAKEGENLLELYLASPLKFIEDYKPEKGREIHMCNTGTMPGSQYLRKPHCMFGWDWGPQLPDAGIFRKIELVTYEKARLLDTLIRQKHEEGQVTLTMTTDVEKDADAKVTLTYEVLDPDGKLLSLGTDPVVKIEEPRLWWPHGNGEQPLYTVRVIMESEGEAAQEKLYRIGLRTVTVSREDDEWGQEFAITVNGKKIFARGADYIPDDCYYSRLTREVFLRDVQAAVFANFNCLRIWGGGYYPSDEFYDLCDEYGILLWQDLMYACNIYDLTESFEENIVEEARDNILRFRNHACLALICGNNELESAWTDWSAMQGHAPSLKRDYLIQFEYLLSAVVKETAPDTFYWPSSPSSGGSFDKPNDDNRGDAHYWDVWHGQLPFSEYLNHYFRFCSEFGFQSLPSIKTIETFTEEKDRNLFSKVMESHQKNPAANGKILYYLSETFRYPGDLSGLTFLSQILQGYAMKVATEHWRRNRGRCMGSIYWQFNDNWPVASWSSMDYYGRYKALHYMARVFNESVAGSICKEGNTMGFWISNESLREAAVEMKISLKDLDFQVLYEESVSGTVAPLSAADLLTKDFSELIEGRSEQVFVTMEYKVTDKETGKTEERCEFETFVPVKHLELKDPELTVSCQEDGTVTLSAKSFAPYCMVEGIHEDIIWDSNVLAMTDGKERVLHPVKGVVPGVKPEIRVYDVYHTYA